MKYAAEFGALFGRHSPAAGSAIHALPASVAAAYVAAQVSRIALDAGAACALKAIVWARQRKVKGHGPLAPDNIRIVAENFTLPIALVTLLATSGWARWIVVAAAKKWDAVVHRPGALFFP